MGLPSGWLIASLEISGLQDFTKEVVEMLQILNHKSLSQEEARFWWQKTETTRRKRLRF